MLPLACRSPAIAPAFPYFAGCHFVIDFPKVDDKKPDVEGRGRGFLARHLRPFTNAAQRLWDWNRSQWVLQQAWSMAYSDAQNRQAAFAQRELQASQDALEAAKGCLSNPNGCLDDPSKIADTF